MNGAQFGYFVGSFAFGLLIFAICLGVIKVIPPLRGNPGLAYTVSGGMGAWPPLGATKLAGAPVTANLIAAVLIICIAFWGYRRATKAK